MPALPLSCVPSRIVMGLAPPPQEVFASFREMYPFLAQNLGFFPSFVGGSRNLTQKVPTLL